MSKAFGILAKRSIASLIAVIFAVHNVWPVYAQSVGSLPIPGERVALSAPFAPALLKAVKVHTDNPFQFDFIVDTGDSNLEGAGLREESNRLIKYFLAALTTPESDLWVNLSPYEKDKIIPPSFGETEMGRDLLAQDYILKQITASIIYPEEQMGKTFWDKVYAEAQAKYGTTDIPVNTFNKVWIVPEKSVVYESGTTAYVTETRLKVMLEEDYLSLQNNKANGELGTDQIAESDVSRLNSISSKIVREIVIPALEKEVNTGKNFASIRQVFHSLVLAFWYKKRLKDSIFAKLYADKNKVTGVDIDDKAEAQKIYTRYIEAFKTGVYNYIKEDIDATTQEVIPRKYFSGGALMTLEEGRNIEIRPTDNFANTPAAIVGDGKTFGVGAVVNPEQNDLNAAGALPSTSIAHVRNLSRLTRILRLIARSESASLPANSSNFEIVEFLVEQLDKKGLVEETVDQNGIVILKISQRAKEDRLGEAIYRWVMNPEEGFGTQAVNFQSSLSGPWAGRWLIVGLEEALNVESVLRHEQVEVSYRQKNPDRSWIEAHNATVEELKDGVRITREDLASNPGSPQDLGTALWNRGRNGSKGGKFEADLETLRRQGARIIETDMTLDYGGLEKWNLVRILVDLVQNHKPADSKGTRVDVNFRLRNGRILPLSNPEIKELKSEDVEAIEIVDDGIGYDADHLKYFLTTKGSAEEGGKFGEGLKIATAAALKQGIALEFQSRGWQAQPVVSRKTLNEGFQNEVSTYNISFAVKDTKQITGSRTILHSPGEDLLAAAKNLQNLVISLRSDFRPLTREDNVGEIVEEGTGESNAVYVKGNFVLSMPDSVITGKPGLFSYNLFDDSRLNRDRDTLPAVVLSIAIEKLLVRNTNPDVARRFIEESVANAENETVTLTERRYFEQGLQLLEFQLNEMTPESKQVWQESFLGLFGENAIIGEFDTAGNFSQSTKEAIRSGKRAVFLQGTVVQILRHAGIKSASDLYFSREVKVSTGLTLTYRQGAWGYDRILIDAVQNHLGTDSGATQIKVEFALKGEENTWIDLSRLSEHADDQIASVRISDNGAGYDYRLLGLLHSTKEKTPEAAGGWGEGLKMLSAAALRAGLGLELRSRDWQAQAATEKQFFNNAEGKLVEVEALSYRMVNVLGTPMPGSQTIFTQLNPAFLAVVRSLPQKTLALNSAYQPVSRTSAGEIVDVNSKTIYVQGLEVTDTVNDHQTLMAYNFIGVDGIIVSPDRNVLHVAKVREAIGEMLAQTDSVEALAKVIRAAVDEANAYHPEYQNVIQLASYSNGATWKAAWEQVAAQKGWDLNKVVLGTSRTIQDPDAQILLRNMGYQVVYMNAKTTAVIHSLGVHSDAEVLEPKFEFVALDQLTQDEQNILKIREIIDRKLEEMTGAKIETSPLEIFTVVRSQLTGDELTGWNGYWHTGREVIGIARSRLKNPYTFGITYLEEMGHRLSKAGDYTREFTEFFMDVFLKDIFRQNGISVDAETVNPGGIDLTADRLNIEILNQGRDIQFDVDPSRWNDADISGFIPVIINITPIADLPLFLSQNSSATETVKQLSMAK